MLTDLQIRKLTHLFHLHDEDRNGYIEQADYERFIERLEAREGAADPMLRALWMRQWQAVAAGQQPLNSGQIPLAGWLALWNSILQVDYDRRVTDLVSHLLRTMDADGDGRIVLDEVRSWLTLFGQDPAQAEDIFDLCDLNGDGYISGEEWQQLVEQFFYSDRSESPGNFVFGRIKGVGRE